MSNRDAPIIGRFVNNRNRPITMPVSADCYLLYIMMALDTDIFFIWTDDTNFRFIVIYANSANMLMALFSYAIICYIMQYNICMIDKVFGIKVKISGLCINR